MIIRRTASRLPRLLSPQFTLHPPLPLTLSRSAHQKTILASQIPAPTPFVPDVSTFLKLIGRNCKEFESKFPTWETLFGSSSTQLRELGIEPPRTRRYLLNWRERFRQGDFGVWGDLPHVQEGTAELRVVEREGKKVLVNTMPSEAKWGTAPPEAVPASEGKVAFPGIVAAPWSLPVKGTGGTVARITVQEGMWEHKRGHKLVRGGERKLKRMRTLVARRKRGMGSI